MMLLHRLLLEYGTAVMFANTRKIFRVFMFLLDIFGIEFTLVLDSVRLRGLASVITKLYTCE